MSDIPAMYDHTCRAYAKMLEHSARDATSGRQVYEGALTRMFQQELGMSLPYYSIAMRFLKKMDCVRQLSRGGGGRGSRWMLMQEPTEELFRSVMDQVDERGAERPDAQAMRSLNERVSALESRMDLMEALSEEEASA